MFAALALTALQSASASAGAPAPAAVQGADAFVLRRIEVGTAPIFSDAEEARNPLRRLANWTHWTTHESVLLREIWLEPGDRVDPSFAAELERNLRATGLFAEVVVTLRPVEGSDDERDLVVRTRDRLSISGGASGSFVGDVASGGVSLSESNLGGTGDRLSFGYRENDLGETRGGVAYRDRYLLGTWTSASVDVGRTDDGDFYGARLDRPLRFLADDVSWSAAARFAAADADYFALDETVAEAPFEDTTLEGRLSHRSGERFDAWTRGVRFDYTDRVYGRVTGPAAGAIRVPGDTRSLYIAATVGRASIRRFDEVTGIDTLRFVEDVELATRASFELGGTLRDEDGRDTELQPTAAVSLSDRRAIGRTAYLSAELDGRARTDSGEAVGWSLGGRVTAFETSLPHQTLGVTAFYRQAEEDQGLPIQLTLGEGSGLRGYPRQQFTGSRVAGINLENRIDPDLSLGKIDFGAAVFFDAGWAGDPGDGLGRPYTSAGAGLRFGSNELLGRRVLRLDVSFPLDEVAGESLDPLVSFSLGQTFVL